MCKTFARFVLLAITLLTSSPILHRAAADEPSSPALKTVLFRIDGMATDACPVLVERAAKSVDGVRDVKASLETKSADVVYEPAKTSAKEIAHVIKDRTGLDATQVHNSHN